LSLCTRFLSGSSWIEHIRPQTEEEIRHANVLASGLRILSTAEDDTNPSVAGFDSETKFDLDVRRRERLLRKALITYAGATSNFTGESPLMSDLICVV